MDDDLITIEERLDRLYWKLLCEREQIETAPTTYDDI